LLGAGLGRNELALMSDVREGLLLSFDDKCR
jgi:hypothetical protein